MNSLEVFHISLRSTYGKNMEPKLLEQLGTFPREINLNYFSLIFDSIEQQKCTKDKYR
jgi:hypothetical protein